MGERFRASSARRRSGLVLIPVLLLCGAGLVAGVPLTWFIPQTATANRGADSPTATVTTYLAALHDGNEADLLPVLDDDRSDALIRQWRDYRTAMRHGTTAASRLVSRMPITRPVNERYAMVEVAAYPVWAADDGSESHHGAAHVWRFATRADHGWRIVSVTPFPWCGGYVAADACA